MDECFQTLLGAGWKAVHAFVNHELCLDCLDVAADFGVLGYANVVSKIVSRDPGQKADDHDDHHDFNQGKPSAIGPNGMEEGRGTLHGTV